MFNVNTDRMQDNIISSTSGAISSFILMITGIINVSTLLEVIIYALIGGAVGMIGKWIIQIIRFHLERRFKVKVKNNDAD